MTICPECLCDSGGHSPGCRWFGSDGKIHHQGTEGRFWTEVDPTRRLISICNTAMARSLKVGDCYREGMVCLVDRAVGVVWLDPDCAEDFYGSVSNWQELNERWVGIMAAQPRTWVKFW